MIYPITENYIPNWGIWEVIREILQNAMDEGPLKYYWEDDMLVVINAGHIDRSALLLGESVKHGSGTRGQFGEGLKLAMLTAARLNRKMVIETGEERWTPSFEMDESFGIKVLHVREEPYVSREVSVRIECTSDEWLDNYTNDPYGILEEEDAGRVFVGGLYVCTLTGLKHAYNFDPAQLKLNRDRDIPSIYDIQHAASKILSDSQELLEVALSGGLDTSEWSCPPSALAEAWENKYGPDTVPVGVTEQGIECNKLKIVPDWVARIIRGVKSFVFEINISPLERLKKWRDKNDPFSKELNEIIKELEKQLSSSW